MLALTWASLPGVKQLSAMLTTTSLEHSLFPDGWTSFHPVYSSVPEKRESVESFSETPMKSSKKYPEIVGAFMTFSLL